MKKEEDIEEGKKVVVEDADPWCIYIVMLIFIFAFLEMIFLVHMSFEYFVNLRERQELIIKMIQALKDE